MSNYPPPDGPTGPSGPPPDGPTGWTYPTQHLSEQSVTPGRSHKPLLIAVIVVVVLAIAGAAAYLLLRDTGEGRRAAYCNELRSVTKNGHLSDVLSGGGNIDPVRVAQKLQNLAPDAVRDNWGHLIGQLKQVQSGNTDPTKILGALNDVSAITSDASDKCNLKIGF